MHTLARSSAPARYTHQRQFSDLLQLFPNNSHNKLQKSTKWPLLIPRVMQMCSVTLQNIWLYSGIPYHNILLEIRQRANRGKSDCLYFRTHYWLSFIVSPESYSHLIFNWSRTPQTNLFDLFLDVLQHYHFVKFRIWGKCYVYEVWGMTIYRATLCCWMLLDQSFGTCCLMFFDCHVTPVTHMYCGYVP